MPVTQYPRIWFNFLCPPLRPWERAAVDAWLAEADAETCEIVQSQMQLINLAQRSAAGKVVELYYIKSGATPGEFQRRLAVGREAIIVGKVEMTVDGKKMTCQLLAVDGQLFSLEFDQVPRGWLWKPSIHIDTVNVSMRSLKPDAEELQSLLPHDYIDVAARRSAVPANVSLFDFEEIYASTLEEGRFWLFAEVPDIGMLGVKSEGDDRQVYLLYYDGRRSLGLGTSLGRAMERVRELR